MMAVEEIYQFLKENRGFFSAKQISLKLNLNVKSVRSSLNTIARYEDILCEYTYLMRGHKKKRVGLKTRKAWVYAHVKKTKGDETNGRRNTKKRKRN